MSNNMEAAAPPGGTGCFHLPAVDEAVPARLERDLQRAQTLARFAKAAARAGVSLPKGDFLNIEQVVAAQWSQFLEAAYPQGVFDGLAGEPAIAVYDDCLQVVINAQSRLNAYQLKPIVEQLEAKAPGLGWFVESILSQASCHGHQIYDMGMATYMCEVFHSNLEEFTDQGYARALLLENGEDLLAEGQILQETIDALKQQYSFWPSDLLEEVGGHAHLLRHWQTPAAAKPKVMTWQRAQRWLQANGQHPHRAAVADAIQLHRALQRDPQRRFVWNGHHDDTETMGALCFLVWDVPDLLFEAVQHFEQNQYNAGTAVEAFARNILDLADAHDEDLQDLAACTVDYFNRWALLAKLLSHFPIWEEDDET